MDLGSTLRASVEREPDALAIVDGTLRLSYDRWFVRIRSVAQGLAALGVRQGERVVAVLRNGEPIATTYWAAQLLGATFVPVNWRLSEAELSYIVEDAEPRCVLGGPHETISYETLVQSESSEALTQSASEDTCSIMLYTSGTTGRPKGVPRTHRAERAAALAHVAQNRYSRNERTLGAMPLYHTMGIRSLIVCCMLNGTFVAMPRWDPREAAKLIERERVTHLYLAPTLYYDLLNAPESIDGDFRSLRKLGYAGAPMTPALVERCYEVFKPDVFVNHYGSTEIYTFSINDDLRKKPASAGKAGLNERLRVIRTDSRDHEERCDPNETGEIAVHLSSPESFSGYWKRPDADARSISQGWYFTGDLGMVDDDGDLFVLGRVDDMMITGGENVYPAEIEDVMAACPAVGRIAVIGKPDERLGQKIVAFVEPARDGVTPEELDAFARASGMTQFKRPREYVFVRAIPQSPSGKILRTKLRDGEYDLLPMPQGAAHS